MRYFAKARINQHFQFNGKRVDFQYVGNDEGVRQSDENLEAPLVAELDRAADARRGGIRRISAEAYEGMIQKKTPSTPSPSRPVGLPPIRLHNPESLLPKSNAPKIIAPVAAAAPKVSVPPLTTNPTLKLHRGRKSAVEKQVAEAKVQT